MNSPYAWQSRPATSTAYLDEGLRQHMLRVYNYMGLGLAVTGIVALTRRLDAGDLPADFRHAAEMGGDAGATGLHLLLLVPHSRDLGRHRAAALLDVLRPDGPVARLRLSWCSPGTSIARTFFITAAMFGATSLYGYTTRRDLSKMGSFLFMGLIGVIIASLVNLFIGSSALQFAISVIGVLVFTGLTAYDTQNIKEQYAEEHGSEFELQARRLGRAVALPQLHQHLPAAAQPDGRAGRVIAHPKQLHRRPF